MSVKSKYSEELLGLWMRWHLEGIDIGFDRLQVLRYHGYLSADYSNAEQKKKIIEANSAVRFGRDYTIKHQSELIADESIIITSDGNTDSPHIHIANVIQAAKEEDNEKVLFAGKGKVTKKDWDFENGEKLNYPIEFWNWINSINTGWQNKIYYRKFDLYQQQAAQWLAEKKEYSPNDSLDTQLEYLKLERQRCLENSLYGLNKFLYLKEGEMGDGRRKYIAWECQAVVLYIRDLGLSAMIGKLRQVGFSTTIGGASILKTSLSKSYFSKFVTEKGDKGYEIFEDKVKFGLDNFPDYMVPTVSHDTMSGTLRFSVKKGKGNTGGANSKYIVEPPYATVINGGSPNEVLIDEAGNIPIIGNMIDQGRPTMFWVNPATGLVEMKRRLYVWGTGGNMKKGGHAFQSVFLQAMLAWEQKNFDFGIVPLFFNAFAKPGITKEFLEKERKLAYSKTGPDAEESRTIYHQTYPITLDDMFIVGANTLLDLGTINNHILRINSKKEKGVHGYF